MEQDPRALYNDELYRQWRDSRSDWDTEARKDIDFYLGNHFSHNPVFFLCFSPNQ